MTPSGGKLELFVKDRVDVLFVLDFKIKSVDWKRDKSLHLQFSEKVQSASTSRIWQFCVNLLLGTKKIVNSAGFLQAALADYPYCKVNGDSLIIALDQVPEVKAYFANNPMLATLGNFAGVTQINHIDKGLAVVLGLVNK